MGVEEDIDIDIDPPPRYVSKQAPRSQRLLGAEGNMVRLRDANAELPRTPGNESTLKLAEKTKIPSAITFTPPPFDTTHTNIQVQCLSRARIPTPHGPAFLHLYRNNHDNKEHLAIVVDPTQLDFPSTQLAFPIRSRSLDAIWSPHETETDRIVRGAYVGRLTPSAHTASELPTVRHELAVGVSVPPPLIRIHSECFTGETIGSMRCDCGEQLDDALRLISLPLPVANPAALVGNTSTTVPGRGVIVYLRQEGRGIGLLSKLRAYNLQDMGHDTVTANLMLGHGADERGYEVAGAILRDLGVGEYEGGVRLLTNNPEKVRALESEGVRIVERVGMVPRSWRCRQHDHADGAEVSAKGITLIGAGAAHGEELEKYMRTKVERMGHLLNVPKTDRRNAC
jgi:GTP cyclohydrolase II